MSVEVSIITPTFNAEKYIGETIASVIAQEFNNWEYIIVDDGSTDSTIQKTQLYSNNDIRISIYKRKELPKGASHCRNIGIEKAKGKYLIFLDADDLLDSNCLLSRVNFMNKRHKLDFGVFQMRSFGNKEIVLTKKRKDYLAAFLSFDLPWQTTCPIWRTDFLRELNGFDLQYDRIQDPELHVRALLASNKFEVLADNDPDCFYRLQKGKVEVDQLHTAKVNGLVRFVTVNSLVSKVKHSYGHSLSKTIILSLMAGWASLSVKDLQELLNSAHRIGQISALTSYTLKHTIELLHKFVGAKFTSYLIAIFIDYKTFKNRHPRLS